MYTTWTLDGVWTLYDADGTVIQIGTSSKELGDILVGPMVQTKGE